MKLGVNILAQLVLCLSCLAAFAEPETYEASIEVKVSDVRSVLSSLDKALGLKLDVKVYADYAESLRVGHVYAVDFDMHFDGIVFQATYQVAKMEAERVELSFTSFQNSATIAICLEFSKYASTRVAKHSPESCEYEMPIEYEV